MLPIQLPLKTPKKQNFHYRLMINRLLIITIGRQCKIIRISDSFFHQQITHVFNNRYILTNMKSFVNTQFIINSTKTATVSFSGAHNKRIQKTRREQFLMRTTNMIVVNWLFRQMKECMCVSCLTIAVNPLFCNFTLIVY